MARPLRIEYAGAFYHVMNRGTDRQPIFLDPLEDRALFLNVLADAARLWKIRVHAYSLMTNHYHLLLETPLPNLSRAMRHIDGVYTQRLNRKIRRDGALFRGRFKSILVHKESYFLELVRYIHLNGVKAVQYLHPGADPNCSHGAYLGTRAKSSWLSTELALSFFGSDPTKTMKLFDAFVRAGIPDELEGILARKRWPAILGLKDFVQEIRQRFNLAKPAHKEKPQEKDLERKPGHLPHKVVQRVAEIFGVPQEVIFQRNRRVDSQVRQVMIYILRYACHLSYREIGKLMGGLGDTGVFYNLNQINRGSISPGIWNVLTREFGLKELQDCRLKT